MSKASGRSLEEPEVIFSGLRNYKSELGYMLWSYTSKILGMMTVEVFIVETFPWASEQKLIMRRSLLFQSPP